MFLYPGGYVLPDLQVALAFPGGEELPRFSPPLVVEIAQSSHARDREKAAIDAPPLALATLFGPKS